MPYTCSQQLARLTPSGSVLAFCKSVQSFRRHRRGTQEGATMDRSILRTGIPAAIVASVLGFSLLLPAATSPGNGNGGGDHGYGGQCGYGQVQDNDENGNNDQGGGGGGGGDKTKSVLQGNGFTTVHHPATDCNEDENDTGNNGGGGGVGGGGGDRSVTSTSVGSIVHVPAVAPPIVVVSRLGSDGE